MKRRTGQTSTPVLRVDDGTYLAGSATIIDWLESNYPDTPALYPINSQQRRSALDLQKHYDTVVGPAARICIFAAILDDRRYVPDMFGKGKSAPVQWAYRLTFPLARGLIRKGNGLTDARAIDDARATVFAEMDLLAERLNGQRYLVGETFSVADLTAAALLAPLTDPDHPDMKKPEPKPPALEAANREFGAHPACAWVRATYDLHRPLRRRQGA